MIQYLGFHVLTSASEAWQGQDIVNMHDVMAARPHNVLRSEAKGNTWQGIIQDELSCCVNGELHSGSFS